MISKFKSLSFLSTYNRNILSVTIATIVAQIIPILISPILTRIYSPEDFGIYALYMSIVSISVTIATLKYELAIFLPDDLEDSKRIVSVTILISVAFSILLFFIIFFFKPYIIEFFKLNNIGFWLLSIPLVVFFITSYQIYVQWLNRLKNYDKINFYRIINSAMPASLNLVFGFTDLKSFALILSTIITQGFLSLGAFYNFQKFIKYHYYKNINHLLSKYKDFPKYTLPSTLGGEIATQIPALLLGYYFSQAIIGYYLLASRIVTLPFSVIGNSISTVYRQEAIDEFNQSGSCLKIYTRTFKKLFLIGSVPAVILFFFGEFIFVNVFGSEWKIAGKMASFLSVMVFFQILSSPMADTILFLKGQRIDFYLQIGRLSFSVISFAIGGFLQDYELAIILYIVTWSVYYLLHSLFQYKIARG